MEQEVRTIGELGRMLSEMDRRHTTELREIKDHLKTLNNRTGALEKDNAVTQYRLDEAERIARQAGAEAGREAGALAGRSAGRSWGSWLSVAISGAVSGLATALGLGK